VKVGSLRFSRQGQRVTADRVRRKTGIADESPVPIGRRQCTATPSPRRRADGLLPEPETKPQATRSDFDHRILECADAGDVNPDKVAR
jgi:hypothetical protein